MAFGVFDGLHAGHRAFLREAKKHGGELIAVVARDAVVRLLKNKTPRHDENARVRAIRESGLADRVVLGDTEQGTYGVIRRWMPDIICLGHDQHALAANLTSYTGKEGLLGVRLVWIRPYRPALLKSSML